MATAPVIEEPASPQGDDDAAASAAAAPAEPIITPAAEPAQEPEAANDDWRAALVGEDEKLLKFLGRFQSAKAFAEAAHKNVQLVRDRTGHKLPENPSEAELAEYRKQNGIPETPAGYHEKLDDLIVGDDDKPFVNQYFEAMHKLHAPPGLAKAGLSVYYGIVEEQALAQAERDSEVNQQGVDVLREEWGGDYRRNLTAISNYAATLPEPVREMLVGKDMGNGIRDFSRMPDGTRLGDNPEVLKWLASVALEANPLATVVPGAGANQASSIAEEMAAIEKTMRENRGAYNKDEKMQARYRELIEAQQKQKAHG